jgi:serine protease
MRKLSLILISLTCLLSAVLGCGPATSSGDSLSTVDAALQGQWVAKQLNANGERLMLTFTPAALSTSGTNDVVIDSVTPAGDTYNVTAGTYAVTGNQMALTLTQISDFTSSFAVSSTNLSLGTDVYNRESVTSPQIWGQIQVPDGVDDSSVGTLSIQSGTSVGHASKHPSSLTRSPSPVVSGELLVKYKNGNGYEKVIVPSAPQEVSAQSGASPNQTFEQLTIVRQKMKTDTDATMQRFKNDPNVESVVHNTFMHTHSIPSDTLYPSQTNLQEINMGAAWDLIDSLSGPNEVVVAVIDTGIFQNHPDLTGRIIGMDPANPWALDWVPNHIVTAADGENRTYCQGQLDDDSTLGADNDATDPGDHRQSDGVSSWHGTHLAGIIAALRNNGPTGIAGIASNSQIKILPLRTQGRCGNGTTDLIADAVRYAAKIPNNRECVTSNAGVRTCTVGANGRSQAKVINLSLGEAITDAEAADLCLAISQATDAGSLVVVSAGNDHSNIKTYPAACSAAIAVGSVYPNLAFASTYSNYGSNQFLVAPGGSGDTTGGVGIWSTVSTSVNQGKGAGYGALTGTSQAAPQVSAVAALLFSYKPNLTPAQVKDYLKNSAIRFPGQTGRTDKYGYGLLNPAGALLAAGIGTSSGTASMTFSLNPIDFKTNGKNATVAVFNGGATVCSGLKVTSSQPWLTTSLSGNVAPTSFSVTANRKDLPTGVQTATLTVTSTTAGCVAKQIPVSLTVGVASADDDVATLRHDIEDFLAGKADFENTTDVGDVMVALLNIDTNKFTDYARTSFLDNYNFLFPSVAPGKYYLVAGIDTNQDGAICKDGETEPCLIYPTADDPEILEVKSDTKLTDLILTY